MDVPATQSTVTSKICNELDERLPVLSVFPLRFESGTHTAAAHIIVAGMRSRKVTTHHGLVKLKDSETDD